MSSIVVSGDTSGAVTLDAPTVAGTVTVTLPAASGTMLTTASTTGVSGNAISSGTVAEAYGGTGTSTGYYGFKNRIINGAMVIDQRNAGAAITGISSSEQYPVDRLGVSSSSGGVLSAQQSSSAPTGFVNSVVVTVTTAATIFGTSGLNEVFYRIEGYNTADLQWGSASAQTITLSFWVRSSVTGTYSLGIQSNGAGRAYVATYTINTANTWEQKTITVAGDTSGTWLTTNGIGITVRWCLATGTNRIAGSANTWSSGNFIAISSTANPIMGTNGATFYITGVQLEKGATATSFDYRPYGTELALCQRYYYKVKSSGNSYNNLCTGFIGSSTDGYGIVFFPVELRTRPTAMEQTGTATDYAYAHTITATVCSAVPAYQAQTNSSQAVVLFAVASGLTAGQGGRGCSNNNNANAFLAWSAEL
jgi:hypothetical protein